MVRDRERGQIARDSWQDNARVPDMGVSDGQSLSVQVWLDTMDEGVKVTMSDWGGQTGEVGTQPELVQKAHRVSGKELDTSDKGVEVTTSV